MHRTVIVCACTLLCCFVAETQAAAVGGGLVLEGGGGRDRGRHRLKVPNKLLRLMAVTEWKGEGKVRGWAVQSRELHRLKLPRSL